MITPLDIHNKVFGNSFFGGYSKEEVDMFLDKVAEDYEKIYKENIELRDKINVLNDGINHYKSMEETLQNTLIVAQNTAEDIKKNAYAKSDNIVKEAEMRASKVLSDANDEIIRSKKEIEDLKRKLSIFKSKMEGTINSFIELLRNVNENEIDTDLD